MPRLSTAACPSCAGGSPQGLRCGQCLARPPAFDETVAAFFYRFPLDKLILSFKFNENLALTPLFSDALLLAVSRRAYEAGRAMPDRVIALPLASTRLAERGFNQSALVAERIAKKLGVASSARGLLKIRETPPQAGLGREARLKNVRGAFDCGESIAGQHIAIVDDVMTTGATMSEAARVLKNAGASYVSAWVVARADRLSPQLGVNADGNVDGDGAIPF
ncbi:MAG: phosphoribosyltransferase family protein [Betaproteobacteria bacterium]